MIWGADPGKIGYRLLPNFWVWAVKPTYILYVHYLWVSQQQVWSQIEWTITITTRVVLVQNGHLLTHESLYTWTISNSNYDGLLLLTKINPHKSLTHEILWPRKFVRLQYVYMYMYMGTVYGIIFDTLEYSQWKCLTVEILGNVSHSWNLFRVHIWKLPFNKITLVHKGKLLV